jgi:tetratricopeptide (TPR) repeat protein
MQDRSIDLIKRTLGRARGTYRRTLTLQLARRQVDAAKLSDAEATLRGFYAENRGDVEVFGELAKTLGAANKLPELAVLYQEAFKDVRTAGLGGDEARSRVASLRVGVQSFNRPWQVRRRRRSTHRDHQRISGGRRPFATYGIRRKATSLAAYRLLQLSRESFKNYRWQVVLGRIYERQGNLNGASDQYRTAVVNEPQRPDLRLSLASTLTRQRRYDDAIATLREGWTLSGRDPQWLIEVARIQVRQGLREPAIETMRQALAAKQNSKIAAQLTIASQLASWGLHSEAVRIYDEGFAKLPKSLKEDYVSADQVTGYVTALMRVEPALPAFRSSNVCAFSIRPSRRTLRTPTATRLAPSSRLLIRRCVPSSAKV